MYTVKIKKKLKLSDLLTVYYAWCLKKKTQHPFLPIEEIFTGTWSWVRPNPKTVCASVVMPVLNALSLSIYLSFSLFCIHPMCKEILWGKSLREREKSFGKKKEKNWNKKLKKWNEIIDVNKRMLHGNEEEEEETGIQQRGKVEIAYYKK